MINTRIIETEVYFELDGYTFSIPKEIYDYLVRTDGFNEDNILTSKTKAGVVTLKIKSLMYNYFTDPENGIFVEKSLNLYKNTLTNTNLRKEEINMSNNVKVVMKYMPSKNEKYDKTKFQIFCDKQIYPKVFGVEFANKEEVKSKLEEIIKSLTTEFSTWTIEDNTKSEGYVLKNEFKLKNGNIAHGIAFANILPAAEVTQPQK